MKILRVDKGHQDRTSLLLHEREVSWYHKGQERQKSLLGVDLDAGTPKTLKGFAAV